LKANAVNEVDAERNQQQQEEGRSWTSSSRQLDFELEEFGLNKVSSKMKTKVVV
jgi:hypothetical protein